jgi:hypothetical protein
MIQIGGNTDKGTQASITNAKAPGTLISVVDDKASFAVSAADVTHKIPATEFVFEGKFPNESRSFHRNVVTKPFAYSANNSTVTVA